MIYVPEGRVERSVLMEEIIFDFNESERKYPAAKSVLVFYLKQKLEKMRNDRPRLYSDRFDVHLPLDIVLWSGYVLCSAVMLFLFWPTESPAVLLFKALTVGGYLLLFHAAAVASHFFYLVWKDLVRERRNEFVELSLGEVLRKMLDYERWCR